ncbi:hypothetical protein Ancab_038190, partial [Ancistrocladus abbreviatus]
MRGKILSMLFLSVSHTSFEEREGNERGHTGAVHGVKRYREGGGWRGTVGDFSFTNGSSGRGKL